MSQNPRRDIIEAILTNPKYNESEKTELVDEFIDGMKSEYPDLKYHATKQDISETELKLTKEIKELDLKLSQEISDVRKEIKELDVKLTREIKELDVKLSKDISNVRKEIKELDIKLTTEISDVKKDIANSKIETIKWIAGMLFVQVIAIGGLFLTAFKLFSS
ncbi:MAG: hypothetical protein ABGW74_02665 [Campylobacterales bacterium]|jgi:phenylalanyl-tRNA synthetase alpha subunit